jgi:hypothetical protein
MDLYDIGAAATAAAAGAVTLSAIVPEIVKYARTPHLGVGVVLERTKLQATGNALWVLHAAWTANLWLGTMTGIGCALALVLHAQGLRGRRLAARERVDA